MAAEEKVEVFSFYRPFEGKGDSIAPFKATAQSTAVQVESRGRERRDGARLSPDRWRAV